MATLDRYTIKLLQANQHFFMDEEQDEILDVDTEADSEEGDEQEE